MCINSTTLYRQETEEKKAAEAEQAKIEAEKAKKKGRNKLSNVPRSGKKDEERVKLDLCKVHEAYQFLYKRYCTEKFRMAAHAAVSEEKKLAEDESPGADKCDNSASSDRSSGASEGEEEEEKE